MSMNFDEVRLPTAIALGARGGPERRTEIVTLGSGREHRNQLWLNSRRRWDVGYGIKTLAQLEELLAFFEERRGRMHGFRFKDRLDFRSSAAGAATTALDQVIGAGNGTADTFQLCKVYGANSPYTRAIKKPVSSSVRVAVAGVEKTIATHFTVDTTTGIVTFTPGNIPTLGQQVTAGFEFDVPVRFDTDFLEIDAAAFEAGSIQSVPILEVRP